MRRWRHGMKVMIGMMVLIALGAGAWRDEALAAGKVYWTALAAGKIQRATLDGTGVEELVNTGEFSDARPWGLALDVAAGKMYWTTFPAGTIQRANLDGTGVEDLVTGLDFASLSGIALDVTGGKMYWTALAKIQRASLDGTGVEDLVNTGVDSPFGIALDVAGGKMYWDLPGFFGKIQRANLDGTGVEDLVESVVRPQGIALDVAGGKMYWTDSYTNKIQRANLGGTGVEDLVTSGLINPQFIALDVAGRKMYWPDSGTDKIQRANLDGTGVEDLLLLGGFDAPVGIALDLTEGGEGKQLTALSPAKIWVGLRNSDDIGLRLDLKAEVFVNSDGSPPIGTGHLNNVSSGSSGFNNAVLDTIPLALIGGPVTLAAGDQLLLRVSVRRTCGGGGHASGTPRLWYNGKAVDTGVSRDAASRFGATIDGSTDNYYLLTDFTLSTTPGTARTSIDTPVNSRLACPNRTFTSFGTWSVSP